MSSFTPAGASGVVSQISLTGAENPTITIVSMVVATQEYSFELPTGTKQYRIRLRAASVLQLSFIEGDSGVIYTEVPRYCYYADSDLLLASPLTIYFQSSQAAQTAEILVWT